MYLSLYHPSKLFLTYSTSLGREAGRQAGTITSCFAPFKILVSGSCWPQGAECSQTGKVITHCKKASCCLTGCQDTMHLLQCLLPQIICLPAMPWPPQHQRICFMKTDSLQIRVLMQSSSSAYKTQIIKEDSYQENNAKLLHTYLAHKRLKCAQFPHCHGHLTHVICNVGWRDQQATHNRICKGLL